MHLKRCWALPMRDRAICTQLRFELIIHYNVVTGKCKTSSLTCTKPALKITAITVELHTSFPKNQFSPIEGIHVSDPLNM